jgi:hypothetical protein
MKTSRLYPPIFLTLISFLISCGDTDDMSNSLDQEAQLEQAESFINAFYSFNPSELEIFLGSAAESAPSIIYYQGWAEGANYKVHDRKACLVADINKVTCSITVEDDPILALQIDYRVTDTFHIAFENREITSIETSSDDPQIYYDARSWVQENHADLIAKPCIGFFDDGPTPADCARAYSKAYAMFTDRETLTE